MKLKKRISSEIFFFFLILLILGNILFTNTIGKLIKTQFESELLILEERIWQERLQYTEEAVHRSIQDIAIKHRQWEETNDIQILKNSLISHLGMISFCKDLSISIREYSVDAQGESGYSFLLTMNNFSPGQFLPLDYKDANEEYVFLKEYYLLRAKGEGYFISWNEVNDNPSEYLNYSRIYPNFHWIVTGTMPLNDYRKSIQEEQDRREETASRMIFQTTIVSLGILLLSPLLALWIRRRIEQMMQYFEQQIKTSEKSKRDIEEQGHNQRLEALNMLAGGFAHQFNNLLQPISGYTDLLLSESELSKKIQYAKSIQDSVDQAIGLTNQIQIFSKRQYTKMKIVDFNLLLSQSKSIFQSTMKDNISLDFQIADEPFMIEINPTQWEQLFTNLALYCEDNSFYPGFFKVESSVKEDSMILKFHLSVEAPPNLKQIFDPYYYSQRNWLGNGLGLSIVKGIVGNHHGHIHAEENQPRGLIFIIKLSKSTQKS